MTQDGLHGLVIYDESVQVGGKAAPECVPPMPAWKRRVEDVLVLGIRVFVFGFAELAQGFNAGLITRFSR
jgi:hypothetical protein